MHDNILITGIGISYPASNRMNYEEMEKIYDSRGVRLKSLMKILGKETRYSITLEMDYFSFLEEAALQALQEAQREPGELDMVVVATDTPEYLSPSNAIKLSKRMNAIKVKTVYDMNANCAGGVIAIDNVCRYLLSNMNYHNALVVTAFFGSYLSRIEDPIGYCTFSDSAAALVLEKRKGNVKNGFLDSCYKTNWEYDFMDVFPSGGFKDVLLKNKRQDENLKLGINSDIDLSFIPEVWEELILEILAKNEIKSENITQYLFSQFSLYHIKSTMAKLHMKEDKYTYVGLNYGYNGCCSPIFALKKALDEQKIKSEDFIILCGAGAGFTSAGVLYQY